LPVWQKNLSQSHDGVAQFLLYVELAVVLFAALYCSGLLAKTRQPRLLIVKRHGGSVPKSP
jgi:hypothetical protein